MTIIKHLLPALAFLGALGVAPVSNATTITDVFNPHDVRVTTYNSPYTYQHNLLDDGYIPGSKITSASLVIKLYDPTDLLWAFGEVIKVTFEDMFIDTIQNVTFHGQEYKFGVATSLLEQSGLLNVSLKVGCNGSVFGACVVPQDFVFAQSTLTAEVADVPEPATVALVGLGLLGFAVSRRKTVKDKIA